MVFELPNNLLENPWLATWGVLGVGFLGSFHCAAMCGPLCTGAARTLKEQCLYHSARFLSYAAIASGIYFVKSSFSLSAQDLGGSRWVGSFFCIGLILWGLSYFKLPRGLFQKLLTAVPSLPFSPLKVMGNWLAKHRFLNSFSLGFLNGFIPCGWLWAFLLISLMAPSFWFSLLWTLAFWISGLPVFTLLHFSVQRFRVPYKGALLRVLAIVIIAMSGMRLKSYWVDAKNHLPRSSQETPSCH